MDDEVKTSIIEDLYRDNPLDDKGNDQLKMFQNVIYWGKLGKTLYIDDGFIRGLDLVSSILEKSA